MTRYKTTVCTEMEFFEVGRRCVIAGYYVLECQRTGLSSPGITFKDQNGKFVYSRVWANKQAAEKFLRLLDDCDIDIEYKTLEPVTGSDNNAGK